MEHTHKLHVLIVDDELDAREILKSLLEDAGHTTCWAATGEGAMKLLKSEKIDAVLLDMNLGPGASGWDVLRYKLQYFPEIPTIIVSGESPAAIHQGAITNLLQCVVVIMGKPVDMKTLHMALVSIKEKIPDTDA
jgi:DNA-binding NtrC family response regulator